MTEPIINKTLELAAAQGFGYFLFVCLLLYVLWTTNKRELRLQSIIDKLSDTISVDLHAVKGDITDIKEEIKMIGRI